MKNLAVLTSKEFLKALAIVVVGLAIALGAGDYACKGAELVGIDTGKMCVADVAVSETL